MNTNNKCCSTCNKTLPPSSFLANASADPESRVFATCFLCRERSRSNSAKRKATQLLGPPRPPPRPQPLALVETYPESRISSTPADVSVPPLPVPVPAQLVPPPAAGFLPADQWGSIQNFHGDMNEHQMEPCTRCRERGFVMDLKDGICHSCFLRDKGNETPFLMSTENEMDPGAVPAHLPKLSQVEEMVIARSHVQMMVYRYRGHQYHYTGHCVSFLQNNAKMIDLLPSLPSELDVVLLQPSNQVMDTDPRYRRQFRSDFRVRKGCVMTWLQYLKVHHPDYRYITISPDRINALPVDGDVSSSFPTVIDHDDLPAQDQVVQDELAFPPNSQSMVPNLDPTMTESDLILNDITGRRPLLPGLPAPSIQETPIDEASGRHRIFAMAFPTLYPTGNADFNTPRVRTVALNDYAQHMLCYQDGRFGSHPRWRFFIFNIIMRRKASAAARFYVSKASGLKDLSREELAEALLTDDALLPQIVRQGSNLSGTRPFWRSKSNHLQAQARFLSPSMSPAFVTFSAADMQWYDLHRHFPGAELMITANDHTRRKWIWDSVQDNPHIIAHYLLLRLNSFKKHVLRPFLGYVDHWDRCEWQSRGTGHEHGIYWIPDAPSLNTATEQSRLEFARYWGLKITAWNPNQSRLPDARNPASLAPADIANTEDQFAAFLNRLQVHSACRVSYCLRVPKDSDAPPTCRFFFPRPLFPDPVVTQEINHKAWLFSPARNQANLNQCAPAVTMGWMANTDIQPPTSLNAVLSYIGKYVSKPEKSSTSYTELQAQILPYVNDRAPLLSFVSKMLNKLIGERDWSAQEVSHFLLQLPVQGSSRALVSLDCRPEDVQRDLIAIDSGEVTAQRSVLQKYRDRLADTDTGSRDPALVGLSLFDCLQNWDWAKWRVRPRASARVINYFPKYESELEGPSYGDYCRVRLMLHHPFIDWEDLLSVDGQLYESYIHAFQACTQSHTHPDDFYTDPEAEC